MSLPLGMGSAHLLHADKEGSDTPGKIGAYSPAEGKWVLGGPSTLQMQHLTVRSPSLTRIRSEPGIKPRNESGTFLPSGRRARYK